MSTLIALSALLLAAPALSQSTGTGSCTDVHIFLARGWNEQYPGRQGTFEDDLCAALSGMSCDYEDVAYDAMNGDWCTGVNDGISKGTQQIEAYAAKCPGSALVVSGYSEGAGVIGGILAGGGGEETGCDVTSPLSTTTGASCQIAAALLWGDPRHAPNQAYDVLNGTAGQGVYPRSESQLEVLDFYTPRLHSYCQYDDLACAKGLGADSVEAHTNYFDYYSEDGASWAAQAVKSYSKGMYCSKASSTSTSSAAATSMSSSMSSAMSSASASASSSASTTASISGYSSASTASSPSTYVASSTMEQSSASNSSQATASMYSTPSMMATTVTDLTTYSTTICPLTAVVTMNGTTSTSIGITTSTVSSVIKTTYTTTAPAYTASPVTETFYKTSLITITSCGPEVVSCPARSTVVKTTSTPVSTSVFTPTNIASESSYSATPYTETFYTTSQITVTSASSITIKVISVPMSTSVVTPTGPAIYSTATSIPATIHTTISGKPVVIGYSTSTSLTTYGPFPTFTHSTAIPTTTLYVGYQNGTAYYPTGTGAAKPSGTGMGGSAVPYTGGAQSVKAAGLLAGAVGVLALMMI